MTPPDCAGRATGATGLVCVWKTSHGLPPRHARQSKRGEVSPTPPLVRVRRVPATIPGGAHRGLPLEAQGAGPPPGVSCPPQDPQGTDNRNGCCDSRFPSRCFPDGKAARTPPTTETPGNAAGCFSVSGKEGAASPLQGVGGGEHDKHRCSGKRGRGIRGLA